VGRTSLDQGDLGRVAAARSRALVTKRAIAVTATIGFGVLMVLARVTYAGHAKQSVRPLAIPPPLYDVVRRSLLQAGIVAPATAPPDIITRST
jgi:hypothetical protein